MASGSAVLLVVRGLAFGVRPVRLRLPFKFGAITLQNCPQLFVRADVEVADYGSAQGFAAEMMVPKAVDEPSEEKMLPLEPAAKEGVVLMANVPLTNRAAFTQAGLLKASPVAQGISSGAVIDVNVGPSKFAPTGFPGQSGAPFGNWPTP